MISDIDKLIELVQDIQTVFNSSCSWETKYDIIFGQAKNVRHIMSDLGMHLEYADPDTTYEADVTAYVKALLEKVEGLDDVLRKTSQI